ncbi:MAG: hypothetical protein FJ038_14060 [Chloroflexi bacterium]|nr:hypothetical protein [Chloroflexota bacterium]
MTGLRRVRRLTRPATLAIVGLVALGWPATVAAHSLSGRLETPLPLVVYLAGAALAVGLSFAFVLLRDVRADVPPPGPVTRVPRPLVLALRTVGLIGWLWIVAQAIIGGSSDADVATLFLWVYGWVLVAILSAVAGPVWTWLDPFATLNDLGAAALRRAGVRPMAAAEYPAWLGEWPAVAGLIVVVWLELVYPGGNLGLILVGYTGLTLAAMAQWGRDPWREHGETFSVWFATLGRLARFELVGRPGSSTVRRRPFLSGLLGGSWSVALVVLVAVGTGSILYDGLSQTKPWFDAFGFPAVPGATLLLAGFLGLIIALVVLVSRLVGPAAMGAGLLPIAFGYLLAHYLTYLLVDGQRILVAISDPFQLGWDLFGTAFYEPQGDWLPASLVWTFQLATVVGGHVAGAWAGHVVAARSAGRVQGHRLRQVPLAVVMVILTVTTLWSLGQAIVAEPANAGAVERAAATAAMPAESGAGEAVP